MKPLTELLSPEQQLLVKNLHTGPPRKRSAFLTTTVLHGVTEPVWIKYDQHLFWIQIGDSAVFHVKPERAGPYLQILLQHPDAVVDALFEHGSTGGFATSFNPAFKGKPVVCLLHDSA